MTVSASSPFVGISQTGLRLISTYGATVTFTANVWATSSTFTAKAVQLEDDPDAYEKFSLIGKNPVTLLVSAEGVDTAPAKGMLMAWGGANYTVVTVEAIAPAAEAIAWTVYGSA